MTFNLTLPQTLSASFLCMLCHILWKSDFHVLCCTALPTNKIFLIFTSKDFPQSCSNYMLQKKQNFSSSLRLCQLFHFYSSFLFIASYYSSEASRKVLEKCHPTQLAEWKCSILTRVALPTRGA